MKGTYIPIRTDDFNTLKELCELWGITGLSVTVPHKKTALNSSDYQSSAARSIGAANTLIRGKKGWRAENTDAAGFLEPLLKKLGLSSASGLKGKKAVIVGAGGASRAAVHALVQAGMSVVILNRTVEKARILAEETGQIWGPLSEESSVHFENGVELLIQTTTVGMHPHSEEDPLPWWNPENCALVYDMIYQPAETLLMSRARDAGVKTMNGSEMLEAQARLQFRLFTGKEAPD
jgi:3-dehydroquinate dehydratase/shikimate dehydrogenase